METKDAIGMDVSKATLDAHIHSNKCTGTFENSKRDFPYLSNGAYATAMYPLKISCSSSSTPGLKSKGHLAL